MTSGSVLRQLIGAIFLGLLGPAILVVASFYPFEPLDMSKASAQEPTPGLTQTFEPPTPTDTPTEAPTVSASATMTGEPSVTFGPETETTAPTETPGLPETPTPSATPYMPPTPTATATVEVIIDESGGLLDSPDGLATLVFPAGATDEPLLVRISQEYVETLKSFPDDNTHLLAAWRFDAFAVDRANAEVDTFLTPVTVNIAIPSEQMFGVNEELIRYWQLDDVTNEWAELPVVATDDHIWSVELAHFSTQATTSDGLLDLPPILHLAQVGAFTGTGNFSLPLKVSPGRAGLQPQLSLSYDSGRIDELHQYTSPSWVGRGWDLSVPSITRQEASGRHFINLPGYGGDLTQVFGLEYSSSSFDCQDENVSQFATCPITIRDQSGHTYVFGEDLNSTRYYLVGSGFHAQFRIYQWDLSSVTNVHGDRIEYVYDQVFAKRQMPQAEEWVISSYPSEITYPGGKVVFDQGASTMPVTGTSWWHYDTTVSAWVHPEARFDAAWCSSPFGYAFETRGLEAVTSYSRIGGTDSAPTYAPLARFEFDLESLQTAPCAARLDSVDVFGTDYATTEQELHRVSFDYEDRRIHQGETEKVLMPYLSSIENGFGAETTFVYTEKINGSGDSDEWNRTVVSSKVTTFGFNTATNPAQTINYIYDGSPIFVDDPEETGEQMVFRGFDKVDERDDQNKAITRHTFINGNETPTTQIPDPFRLSGRQLKSEIIRLDGAAQSTRRVTENWFGVTGDYLHVTKSRVKSFYPVNAYGEGASPTLGEVNVETRYQHDTTLGRVTEEVIDGDLDANTANDDCKRTTYSYYSQAYVASPAQPRLVLPTETKVYPCSPQSPSPTPTSASESKTFFDGQNAGPYPRGLLTASRTLADRNAASDKQYVFTRTKYDTHGMPLASSVPQYGAASLDVSGNASGAIGDVWTNKGRTETAYTASTGGRFPASSTTFVYTRLDGTTPAAVPTQTTSYSYDAQLGVPLSVTAPNGFVAESRYDEYGRTKKTWSAPDTETLPTTEYFYTWDGDTASPTYGAGVNATRVRHRLMAGQTAVNEELACMDGMGRKTQMNTIHSNFVVATARRDIAVFDSRGLQVGARSFLRDVGSELHCDPADIAPAGSMTVSTLYNHFGDPTEVTRLGADGTTTITTKTHYGVPTGQSKMMVYSTDGEGFGAVVLTDDLGRTDQTGVDAFFNTGLAKTKFNYSMLGMTSTVENFSTAYERTTTISYDNLGRKLSLKDPDMSGNGVGWKYGYDAAGNLITQTDARGTTSGVVTTLEYDSLSRLVQKSYNITAATGVAAMAPVTFTYDRYNTGSDASPALCASAPANSDIGQLTIMSDERGSSRWCYDARGQKTAERRAVNTYATPFDIHYTYDTAGRVQNLTYPDGDVVSYQYDDEEAGGLSSGKLYSFASDAAGTIVGGAQYGSVATSGPTHVDFGNGAYSTYAFDTLNRLNSIETRLSGQVIQDLDYTYWKTDNIKSVTDHVPSPDDAVFYNYDGRGRIVEMRKDSNNGALLASYTYGSGADEDKLVAKDEGGLLSYQFTDANHPHAVTKAGNDTLTYDNNGNIKSRLGGEAYTFDAENRLASIASYPTQTDYWYDGQGNMICRATSAPTYPGAVDSKTVYIGGIYEATSEYGATPVITKYYLAFGRVIAQRSGTQTSYYLSDHLGTTAGMVLDDGTVQTSKYYPFGKLRSGGASTDKMYTGQQMEGNSRLGAYFYRARFYSPALGHFLSADSLTVDGLNRYGYVRNNPLRLSDPTGQCGTGQQYDSLLWNDCNNEPWCGAADPDCYGLRAVHAACEASPWETMCGGNGVDPSLSPAPPVPQPSSPSEAVCNQNPTPACQGVTHDPRTGCAYGDSHCKNVRTVTESGADCLAWDAECLDNARNSDGCAITCNLPAPTEFPCLPVFGCTPEPQEGGCDMKCLKEFLGDPDCFGLTTDVVGAVGDVGSLAPSPWIRAPSVGIGVTADVLGVFVDAYVHDWTGVLIGLGTAAANKNPSASLTANSASVAYSSKQCAE